MVSIILVIAGFAGLVFGGNFLVQGAVEVAQRLRVSPLVIGLTLVGFGTSMPELVTSVQAAFAGSPGIALGNIVGSNTANILLILGLAALIRPIAVARSTLRRDGTALVLVTAVSVAVILGGTLSRPIGLLLIAGLAVYVISAFRGARGAGEDAPLDRPDRPLWQSVLFALGGIALTIGAARVLIIGATDLARLMDVSEAVIGLTIVAVGTSLPELVTSVIAARKNQSDVAIGNIIGSNIFNLSGIMGVTAVLKPLQVPDNFAGFDIWVMAGATALLIIFARSNLGVSRAEGGVLLGLYLAYMVTLGLTA